MDSLLCGRPLKYGDPEQIAELKRLRRIAEEEAGKNYKVTFSFSGEKTVEVKADNEREARWKAEEVWVDFEVEDFCDIISVESLKPNNG